MTTPAGGNRFDFNPGRRKKVLLSIDGGGMRGTIVVAMLAELEAQLGHAIYDLVDMVGGTSTGAVIAASIGLRMSAQEILDVIYKDRLARAFGKPGLLQWVRFALTGFRYLYDLRPFVEAMAPLAGRARIHDLQQPIVLLTVKDLRTSNTYFVVSAGPGAQTFGDWPVVGAVAASGAAPIFFPPVLGNLVDGGVGVYDNPCLAVTTEAMEYIGAPAGFVDGNVIHVSIGTGYTPNDAPDGAGSRWHMFDWLQYVITSSLEDSALQQAFATRAIYGSRMDFRRYDPLLTKTSVEDALGVYAGRLDPMKLTLDSCGPEEIALMENIGRAYARKIDWRDGGVMPWDTVGGRLKPDIQPAQWQGSAYDR